MPKNSSIRGSIATTAAILVAALAISGPVRAAEFQLTLDNDFLTTNPIDDDLYTAGLRVGYSFGRYELAFVESLFTDSGNDLRFDETYLSIARLLDPVKGWHPRGRVGALRVGRGLFGESLQNAVHDMIGDERVALTYVDTSDWYPTFALDLRRESQVRPTLTIASTAMAASSFGFKSAVELSAELIWSPLLSVWFGVEVGGRYTDTSFAALEPWIERFGALWGFRVGLPGDLVLSWTYNEFGTELQHFSVLCRWRPGRDRGAGTRQG